MKKIITLVIGLCALIINGLVGIAQNDEQWQQAYRNFGEKGNKPQVETRTKIVAQLGEAIYPKVEHQAAMLLTNHIKNEIGRAKGDMRLETETQYQPIEASVNVLKKISQPKAVEYLLKIAQDKKSNWRIRFYVTGALGGINTPEVISALTKLIDDSEIHLRMAAFDALAELNAPNATERTCQLLKEDTTWELKIAALNYLSKLNDEKLIEPLINALQNNGLEGVVRTEIVDLLKQLTGINLGLEGKTWLTWWKKKQAGEKNSPTGGVEETTAVFYGIKTTSTRIIFLIDISGSMSRPVPSKPDDTAQTENEPSWLDENGRPPNQELVNKLKSLKDKLYAQPVQNRLDAARRELVNAIYRLDSSVEFTIILFDESEQCWKDTMVRANIENKILALEYITKKFGGGSGTAMYEALEYAYKFARKNEKPGNTQKDIVQFDKNCYHINELGGADTFFMVTDGAPAHGKLGENKEALFNEIKKITQLRRVKINTIAIGELPVDPDNPAPDGSDVDIASAKNIATITGGVFINKTSENPKKHSYLK